MENTSIAYLRWNMYWVTLLSDGKGDRAGLRYLVDHAYLQTPLTLDRDTATTAESGSAKVIGTQTAIGDGIGLATKTFVDSDALSVMILTQWRRNTAGVLDPLLKRRILQKKYNAIPHRAACGWNDGQRVHDS